VRFHLISDIIERQADRKTRDTCVSLALLMVLDVQGAQKVNHVQNIICFEKKTASKARISSSVSVKKSNRILHIGFIKNFIRMLLENFRSFSS